MNKVPTFLLGTASSIALPSAKPGNPSPPKSLSLSTPTWFLHSPSASGLGEDPRNGDGRERGVWLMQLLSGGAMAATLCAHRLNPEVVDSVLAAMVLRIANLDAIVDCKLRKEAKGGGGCNEVERAAVRTGSETTRRFGKLRN
ncbi:hypothetical protein LINPERPRIM_LOCUS7792 [Linum perenne]